MIPIADLEQPGATYGWLFLPTAVLLGALHGLEPGHAKTMMAGFIIAIRGTLAQAALLAVTATISHTALVWLVALAALTYGEAWQSEANEPYFRLASGAAIVAIALWMLVQTWRDQHVPIHRHHDHLHGHSHGHAHGLGHSHGGHHHGGPHLDGAANAGSAHARAHAADIEARFSGRPATNWQIAMFGLTGGLIPCPAAVTVLLVCLQIQDFALGIVLVLGFSIGLALTLLAAGGVAAWGVRHVTRRWTGVEAWARRLPYLSSLAVVAIGLYVGWSGWAGIAL